MKKFISCLCLLLAVHVCYGQDPIRVETRGEGDPILYLPGFATPGTVWEDTVAHVEGNYRHHLVSYAGFDGLPPIPLPWYETIKDSLLVYIENNSLDNLTLVGHSMGGSLALELAAAYPGRIHGLVLVDTIPALAEVMMPGVPTEVLQYDSPYNRQMLAMSQTAWQDMMRESSARMTVSEEHAAILTVWALRSDPETYVYGYTELLKLDLRDILPAIRTPALVIAALGATPDKSVVLQHFNGQYAGLVNHTLLTADNSRHFVMLDEPNWFYKALNTYLEER